MAHPFCMHHVLNYFCIRHTKEASILEASRSGHTLMASLLLQQLRKYHIVYNASILLYAVREQSFVCITTPGLLKQP